MPSHRQSRDVQKLFGCRSLFCRQPPLLAEFLAMLSEDESDVSNNEEIHQFTINEHYAKAFEYRKEREELAKRMSLLPYLH